MQNGKEATIYDIANKLNISPATVSRGLSDHPGISRKTKKKILDLAEKIGYRSNHFARNLRNQRTDTIGVIVPRLDSHFMSSVIAGIENIANKEGYNLIISQSSESGIKEATNAKTLFNNRVDGLLVSLAFDTNSLCHFNAFFNKNTPVVFFDRVMDHENCTSIVIDNFRAAYEATSHLIEQGCKRIVHITAPSTQNVYVDRLKGYKKALANHKIRFNPQYVLTGNLSQEAGTAAAEQIIKMKPAIDGVFVANDNCAVGCMIALKQRGYQIPADIAIVGFNNDPVSKVIEPNLSTIYYNGKEMGELAARHLISHLNSPSPVHTMNTIILRAEFIIRDSSLKKDQLG